MGSWQRRTAYYVLLLGAIILGYAVVYDYGMTVFEDDPITFLHALQIVVETFTTTGFGSDAPWTSPEMNVLVIVMDLTGVALIFIALPVLVFPLFEEAIETTVPTAVDDDLADHVVVSTFTPRGETLVAELDSWGVDHVIVEPDADRAAALQEGGYDVIHADPESSRGLERAGLPAARALVADGSDRVNTSVVLAAKEVAEDVKAISVVEDPARERYHHLAGADVVLSPRELLGRSLASKVVAGFSTTLEDVVEIDEDFEVAELLVEPGSDLVGRTIAESGIRERTGANVVGAWVRGAFETPPSPDATIRRGTVLLVAGREDQLEALKRLTLSEGRRVRPEETLVVGYGEVGAAAADELAAQDVPHATMDLGDAEGVDRVGDGTDPDDLAAAGVEEAGSVILTISDDAATEFATLVVRDLAPTVEVIARAEETENVGKIHRAGADYVLSLATVAGRMIASTVVEGEEVMRFDTQIEVVRTTAPELAGRRLAAARIRERTSCTVVAIERDGEVLTEFDASVRIRRGDELVIAGPDEAINRFRERFGE